MVATDLLRFAWENLYDVAVLVSGDGDFSYAVQAVKDMGKHVEVAAFTSNLWGELAQVADDRELFTPQYFSGRWSRKRGSRPRRTTQAEAPAEAQRRWWRRGRPRSDGADEVGS